MKLQDIKNISGANVLSMVGLRRKSSLRTWLGGGGLVGIGMAVGAAIVLLLTPKSGPESATRCRKASAACASAPRTPLSDSPTEVRQSIRLGTPASPHQILRAPMRQVRQGGYRRIPRDRYRQDTKGSRLPWALLLKRVLMTVRTDQQSHRPSRPEPSQPVAPNSCATATPASTPDACKLLLTGAAP